MRTILIAVLSCVCSFGQVPEGVDRLLPHTRVLVSAPRIYSAATNVSTDLLGPVDTRPGTWGRADYSTWKITFRPPAGHRVRILHAHGDLVSWVRNAPEDTYAGVLLGFSTTGPEGSVRGDLLADACMLYVQDAVARGVPKRTAFNADVRAGGLLEPDNVLVVKIAAWLNSTENFIHSEVSATFTYRWEREKQ